ncbi:MAG TPA: PrsW family glutamic-type intramembrane protease [Bryobacteraceae bacterium]|nr:PrsW family glutamic-type intramembrane protease [Bryobacteraceae bacterium]
MTNLQMIVKTVAQIALSLFPVIIFLLSLELIDTYRLVPLRRVVRTVAIGCGAAAVCWLFSTALYATGMVSPRLWIRSGAPVVEEALKALYVVWLIRGNRVGFMVDAAISGFAIGAGFSLIENLTYIPSLAAAGLLASAVRGLGTAMMHGGTTAIFAVLSTNLAEIRGEAPASVFAPGLALAVSIHVLFNQPLLPPVYEAVLILVGLPVLLSLIFWRSELALENWVGTRLDKDIDLVEMMATSKFSATPAGKYLQSLQSTFASEVVGDMVCYLQLSLELSVRAKGDLLRREMGCPVSMDLELPSRLRELHWLESKIGRAGKLALAPLLGQNRRDIWEIEQLARE